VGKCAEDARRAELRTRAFGAASGYSILGGEDDAAAKEALAKKASEAKDKKAKAAPIAKSIIVWEVKPWGEETDLDELAKKILAIEMDGLAWKTEYTKEPIAYGVFKIVIGAVVEDLKVSTDLV
jgi:translation elongation factor EF-1beta